MFLRKTVIRLVIGLLCLGCVSTLMAQTEPLISAVSVLATNSAYLKQGSDVLSGDVVVNAPSEGPTLTNPYELTVGLSTTTPSGFTIMADTLRVKSSAEVACDDVSPMDGICDNVFCNELNDGSGNVTCSPLGVDPVFSTLPPFLEAELPPEVEDITVGQGESIELGPGVYGDIFVKKNGTILFTGGVYECRSLLTGLSTGLLFAASSDVLIAGKFDTDQNSTVGPAEGASIDASNIVFYVAGINGNSGNLGATPKAAQLGLANVANANFYVPNGTLYIRKNSHVTGAFLGRDVIVGIGAEVSLDSHWTSQPPLAFPQDVSLLSAEPQEITLGGSDPENADLAFSIVSEPTAGSLGEITPIVPDPVLDRETGDYIQPPITSALVTYAPFTGDEEDSFTFKVTDPTGASGVAAVQLWPNIVEPPFEPPETVVANDSVDLVAINTQVTVTMTGDAPEGVSLTFSIVSEPQSGQLGELSQGTETPQRTAFATYTPEPDFVGDDTLEFEACGEINTEVVCDTAVVILTVFEPSFEPADLVVDRQLTAFQTLPVQISFSQVPSVLYATVAGNVADSEGYGSGDNVNALPGPSPLLISGFLDGEPEGEPLGDAGTGRIWMEFFIGMLDGAQLESAQIVLNTYRGTEDALDTFFYSGQSLANGVLDIGDYSAWVEPIPEAIMPVPEEMQEGDAGTFSLDVLNELESAIETGRTFFTIQGRVDENLANGAFQSGLHVRSTADGNLAETLEPKILLASTVEYKVTSLPQAGALTDVSGYLITQEDLPFVLSDGSAAYLSEGDFIGTDRFTVEATDGITIDSALISVFVRVGSCADDKIFCHSGR
ncbi:MAG: hypothetical protein GY906_33400 [bacterium]|nr:hypothetical protein [bacterium]